MPLTPCVSESGSECLVTMRNVQIDIWDLLAGKIIKTVENKVRDWSSHHEGTGIEQRLLVSAGQYVVYAGYRSHQFFIMNIDNPINQIKVDLFEPYKYDKELEAPDFGNVYRDHISTVCIDTNTEYIMACNGPTRNIHMCSLVDGEVVRVIKGDSSLGKIHSFFVPSCSNDWIYFLTKNMVRILICNKLFRYNPQNIHHHVDHRSTFLANERECKGNITFTKVPELKSLVFNY